MSEKNRPIKTEPSSNLPLPINAELELTKKSVDIKIDEYDCEDATSGDFANMSIKPKPQSNLLMVSSKKRLTTSLNTSTSSSLSSSSSISSSANNLNSQQQQQMQSSPSSSSQVATNSHPNTELNFSLASTTLTPPSTSYVSSSSPNATSSLTTQVVNTVNQTSLAPSISINSGQASNSSSSLLTISNITNISGGSTNNLNILATSASPLVSNIYNSTHINSNLVSTSKLNNNNNTSNIYNNSSSLSNTSGTTTVISQNSNMTESQTGHGHFFTKKTFHKPTFCHHCTEMLWGIIGQGFICEVCNFVSHEKCQKSVVSPCSSIAHSLIKNPVAHCWSEPSHFKRKFCNICRKRLEDNLSVRCEICDYFVHVDCQVFAVNDCCETATYIPNRELKSFTQRHHWREGNLPSNSKCVYCKKTCWTSECLAGMKCEWCGITIHSFCRQYLIDECNFGSLKDIIVPPFAVSVPRIDMDKETIFGIQINKPKINRSASNEWPSGGDSKSEDTTPYFTANTPSYTYTINNNSNNNNNTTNYNSSNANNLTVNNSQINSNSNTSPSRGGNTGSSCYSAINNQNHSTSSSSKRKDKYKQQIENEDISKEIIRVYDGDASLRKRVFRTIIVPQCCSYKILLEASLRTFHINDDPNKYFITIPILKYNSPHNIYDDFQIEERHIDEENPIKSIKTAYAEDDQSKNIPKSSILLRYIDEVDENIRIFPGIFKETTGYKTVKINLKTTALETIQMALEKFEINNNNSDKYYLVEVLIDRDVNERILNPEESPLQLIRQLRKETLCNNRMVRFYLQQKEDPHGPSVALFVGNLPNSLSQIQYEKILMNTLKNNNEIRWSRFDVIYYEYGSMVILYDDSEKAVKAFKALKDSSYENKQLMVLLLPTIQHTMIPPNICPLLVFVNTKSGGQQGTDLITSFRHLLNPHQVFNLQNGGPLPGLYVFRNIESYRILACGGDGTIGWVLSCLDNVSQDAKCQTPPMAIAPLGTGNDLARVLRWGAGYTGAEEPVNWLRDVIDAEEIMLDRWTIVFHSDENKEVDDMKKQLSINVDANQPNTNEDNTEIYVMNNYLGIGIDADIALDFHFAREENPKRFNSRLHNKKVFVVSAIRKMLNRSICRDFNRNVTLEVDGRKIDLPQIEGLIILNILSWGSGANPWGQEKEDQFQKPTHYDGMLEVVGVRGAVHLGQIQSGLFGGIRLAQGGRIKIRMNTKLPVQVDGEPWLQTPCSVTIIKSALKATMLKKSKTKLKRRNTEPSVNSTQETIPAENNQRSETDSFLDDGESGQF